ncbi:MAG: SAM-dependent chlorinase/fluorinase [Opitutaceae bacterium]|nr:SAM-dependent chlorinase/fluorinase [Opitutaceae bacterium]
MRPTRLSLLRQCAAALALVFLAPCSQAASPSITTGEIEHARFLFARPSGQWNGRLLIHAHGYRSPEEPLIANLSVQRLAYATLLNEGWIVATTSYRRNGMIIGDAIKDIDALREHIATLFGEPGMVILEGESMGGAIVTLIAERGTGGYSGAVAIGAALQAREDDGTGGVVLQPRIPMIFLTNQSELEGPRNYVVRASAEARTSHEIIAPVLFRVARNGHVNVNQAERLVALRALVSWIEKGRETLPKPQSRSADGLAVYGAGAVFDATVKPPAEPTRVAFDSDDRGFTATVTEISLGHGNVYVDAQPSDFARIGMEPGGYLELKIGANSHRVRYGRDFSSVPRGQWVMFANADGFFWLAVNQGNAARSAGISAGDKIHLRRYGAQ